MSLNSPTLLHVPGTVTPDLPRETGFDARLKTIEKVNELRQIISNYYAQKATEELVI